MSGYEWDFRAAFLHPELWAKALSITLGYAVATTALGLLLGVICGMMLLSRYWIFRAPEAPSCKSSAVRRF
jgi:polar amino acid transport system permease protein